IRGSPLPCCGRRSAPSPTGSRSCTRSTTTRVPAARRTSTAGTRRSTRTCGRCSASPFRVRSRGATAETATSLPAAPRSGPRSRPPTGTLKLLVVPVTWGPEPYSQGQIREAVFGRAAAWLHQSSFGKLTVTGTTLPWEKVLSRKAYCSDRQRIYNLAVAAAKVDVGVYEDVMVVLPPFGPCGESGYGDIGGDRLWIYGTLDTITLVHELGHTLGLDHGNAWTGRRAAECGDPVSRLG